MRLQELIDHCQWVHKANRGCDVCHSVETKYNLSGIAFDDNNECGVFICQRCGYLKFASMAVDGLKRPHPERLRMILKTPVGSLIEQELREVRLRL